jgi:hypothetical protein
MQKDKGLQKNRREDRRAAIAEITTDVIEEVLTWSEAHPRAQWAAIEATVSQARQRFGEQLLEQLVTAREEARPVPGPQCPECGQEMRYKGQKTRQVVSSLGETRVTRGYYNCSACQRGVFPPG